MASVEEVVAILAKHANIIGAPDDAAVLTEYLEQEEQYQQQQQEAASKPATSQEGME